MKNGIKLRMNVEGIKVISKMDDNKEMVAVGTQLQVSELFENKQGDQDIRLHTLKLNNVLSEEEIKDLLNKTIETDEEMGLKEYIFEYDKGYVADTFNVVKTDKSVIFEVNNYIEGTITTATSKSFEDKKTKETKVSTSFTIKSSLENGIKLTTIKVNSKIKDHGQLVGKNLRFDNLSINIFNNKKYISTTTLPKIVK